MSLGTNSLISKMIGCKWRSIMDKVSTWIAVFMSSCLSQAMILLDSKQQMKNDIGIFLSIYKYSSCIHKTLKTKLAIFSTLLILNPRGVFLLGSSFFLCFFSLATTQNNGTLVGDNSWVSSGSGSPSAHRWEMEIFQGKSNGALHHGPPTWRIIPLSKLLITMVNTSHK